MDISDLRGVPVLCCGGQGEYGDGGCSGLTFLAPSQLVSEVSDLLVVVV